MKYFLLWATFQNVYKKEHLWLDISPTPQGQGKLKQDIWLKSQDQGIKESKGQKGG